MRDWLRPGTGAEERLEWLDCHARAMVEDPQVWRAIEVVAAALLNAGRLSGPALEEILDAELRLPPTEPASPAEEVAGRGPEPGRHPGGSERRAAAL